VRGEAIAAAGVAELSKTRQKHPYREKKAHKRDPLTQKATTIWVLLSLFIMCDMFAITHAHTHIHTYTHTHIHTYTHTQTHTQPRESLDWKYCDHKRSKRDPSTVLFIQERGLAESIKDTLKKCCLYRENERSIKETLKQCCWSINETLKQWCWSIKETLIQERGFAESSEIFHTRQSETKGPYWVYSSLTRG